jgi:hypothetical protein
MGLRDTIVKMLGGPALEQLAKNKPCVQTADRMEADGRTLLAHYAATGDGEYNRRVLSHVIGIERWGQSRLKVLLGAPFQQDEYDGYRPARETTWDTLQTQFTDTRAETVRLALELGSKADNEQKVLHNMYGPLTAQAWLNLLNTHANMESRKIKKA